MSEEEYIVPEIIAFEWDDGNEEKNYRKHRVTKQEAEQVFFNEPLIISPDVKHSQVEKRYHGLGKTDSNRTLFVAFTVRKNMIRVISIRDQNKQERRFYEAA